jgi:hypothetical protein
MSQAVHLAVAGAAHVGASAPPASAAEATVAASAATAQSAAARMGGRQHNCANRPNAVQ